MCKPKLHPLFILLALLVVLTGCVKKGVHEGVLEELAQSRNLVDDLTQQLEQCVARVAEREAELSTTQSNLATTADELASCRLGLEEARTALGATGAENARLAERLVELARIEEELRARNEIFDSVLSRFRALIDAGTLQVMIDRGRLVIKLPQDILFGSGSAEVGPDGIVALTEVAQVLATFTDREFQVEGHTDNVPISTSRFPSNWELSGARAIAVVRLFIGAGVNPALVSAAGYGEFRPVAGNEAPETRALNRRIEIVLVPDLAAIFGGAT